MKYNLKRNSLNELRFYLALSVVFIHLSYLSESKFSIIILEFIYPLASRAVDLFFILSGFLIYMSWDKKPLIKEYIMKRFFRLYPLYALVVLSIPLISIIGYGNKFNIEHSLLYIFANLLFLNFLYPTLPNLFEYNNSNIINGALWSLKVEVMFYIILPFLYKIIENSKRPVFTIVFLIILSALFNFIVHVIVKFTTFNVTSLYNQLPAKLYLFLLGICLYKYFHFFKENIIVIIFFLMMFLFSPFFDNGIILSVIVSCLVLIFAFIDKEIALFSFYGDFSYSLYITHFPIIQILITFGMDFSSVLDVFIYSLTQLVVCILCWKLVEMKFLKFSKILQKEI